jgi:DNA-binding transcriptional LysR family regulator
MPGRESKDGLPVLKELDELIRILEFADRGLVQKEIGAELDRTQSHVSRQLKDVRRLTGHSVLKSPASGQQRLSDESRIFLASLRHAKQVLEAAVGPQRFGSVRVRVGAIPSVLTSFMPRVFALLAQREYFVRHPQVAIHMESGTAIQLFEKLDRGLLDFVISYPLEDKDLDGAPTAASKKRRGTDVWRPVQLKPWMESEDIHQLPLFPGRPVGLLYHWRNNGMRALARGDTPFSFDPLASMIVFLTSDPTQPAFETEIERCLPDPAPRKGTRVYLQTFSQIRAALATEVGWRESHDALQHNAVGVGVALDSDTDIQFLDFREVAKRVRPPAPGSRAIRRLAELSTQRFFLYRKSATARPEVQDGLFTELRSCIEYAAVAEPIYTHTYVS